MTMSKPNGCGWLLALATMSVAVVACGGSSRHSATTSAKAPTTATTSQASGGTSVTSGPVHAALAAQGHNPTVKKNWVYTVTASDPQGHPLAGTVLTEFVFQGSVVGKETPPIHRLKKGHFRDVLNFPADSVGYPIDVQVVVRTKVGSVTLDWPVTVHK
jgi:hypothetical protein